MYLEADEGTISGISQRSPLGEEDKTLGRLLRQTLPHVGAELLHRGLVLLLIGDLSQKNKGAQRLFFPGELGCLVLDVIVEGLCLGQVGVVISGQVKPSSSPSQFIGIRSPRPFVAKKSF